MEIPKMTSLTIFQAAARHVPGILKVKKEAHELFVEQRPDVYKESEILYTDDFLERFLSRADHRILAAAVADEIVGYAFVQSVEVQLPMLTDRSYVYIHDLAVAQAYRGVGVASTLLGAVDEFARGIGADKVELAVHIFSDAAISLYEKKGFTIRTLRMEKDLSTRSS